jgi:hypothetical protein
MFHVKQLEVKKINNREVSKLTQKIMDLKFDLKYLKKPKEISKIKEEIMWLVEEINLIERAKINE